MQEDSFAPVVKLTSPMTCINMLFTVELAHIAVTDATAIFCMHPACVLTKGIAEGVMLMR